MIKRVLNSCKKYKKIRENIISLYLLNIANYVFPLLTIPYLLNVLGVEYYGIYIFAYTLILYLTLLIKYGFDFSGTKEIANIRDDNEKLNIVFSSIFFIQLFFAFFTITIFVICILLIPRFSNNFSLYIGGIGILIGFTLFPTYLFQGIENMKFIAIINFSIKFIATLLIFLLVKEQKDYVLAMQIQSIGYISGGIVSMLFVVKFCKIKIVIPRKKILFIQLKNGWEIFGTTIGLSFYRDLNIIILGFITNYTVVGLYAPAEKIVKIFQTITSPIVNAIFPHYSREFEFSRDKKETFNLFLYRGRIYTILLLILWCVLILFSNTIVELYLGGIREEIIIDVKLLSPIILIGGLNYYYGFIGLINMGESNKLLKFVWIAGIISLISCIILSSYMQDRGASISMSLAELILFFLIISQILKIKRNEI
jgi:PST family polysaccharide transporter